MAYINGKEILFSPIINIGGEGASSPEYDGTVIIEKADSVLGATITWDGDYTNLTSCALNEKMFKVSDNYYDNTDGYEIYFYIQGQELDYTNYVNWYSETYDEVGLTVKYLSTAEYDVESALVIMVSKTVDGEIIKGIYFGTTLVDYPETGGYISKLILPNANTEGVSV